MNLSNWSNNKITDMSSLFLGLTNLKTLNLTNFKTNNVTNMSQMFLNCSSLEELNLCSFDTNNVDTSDSRNFGSMFLGTSNLKKITVGSKWTIDPAADSTFLYNSGVSELTFGTCPA